MRNQLPMKNQSSLARPAAAQIVSLAPFRDTFYAYTRQIYFVIESRLIAKDVEIPVGVRVSSMKALLCVWRPC